jgi:hypothetical protein
MKCPAPRVARLFSVPLPDPPLCRLRAIRSAGLADHATPNADGEEAAVDPDFYPGLHAGAVPLENRHPL